MESYSYTITIARHTYYIAVIIKLNINNTNLGLLNYWTTMMIINYFIIIAFIIEEFVISRRTLVVIINLQVFMVIIKTPIINLFNFIKNYLYSQKI